MHSVMGLLVDREPDGDPGMEHHQGIDSVTHAYPEWLLAPLMQSWH